MVAAGNFVQQQQIGLAMLSGLGDIASQRGALGEDYEWVYGTIMGTCTPPPASEINSLKRNGHEYDKKSS